MKKFYFISFIYFFHIESFTFNLLKKFSVIKKKFHKYNLLYFMYIQILKVKFFSLNEFLFKIQNIFINYYRYKFKRKKNW